MREMAKLRMGVGREWVRGWRVLRRVSIFFVRGVGG